MKKNALTGAALDELRTIVQTDAQNPGRVQRGISWPKEIDEAVLKAMNTTGIDRSRLVQVAVAKFLGVDSSKDAARKEETRYEPLGELEPA